MTQTLTLLTRVKKLRTSIHALQESGCEDRYIKEITYDHTLLGRDIGSLIVNRHQPWWKDHMDVFYARALGMSESGFMVSLRLWWGMAKGKLWHNKLCEEPLRIYFLICSVLLMTKKWWWVLSSFFREEVDQTRSPRFVRAFHDRESELDAFFALLYAKIM